ncbi:MAG: HEAT repeat domain-containing protein [Candidatus Tectimicrobiota bacterium]
MALFDKFRVKKALDVLRSEADPASPEYAQALLRLKQIGRPALSALLQALGQPPTPPALIALLTTLVDNTTLPVFIKALSASQPGVVSGVVSALSQSHAYDPQRLLDLFLERHVPKTPLVQILATKALAITPAALFRQYSMADKESRSALLRLLTQLVTEAMLPELRPYVHSEDWLVRLHLAQICGRFNTPVSRECLAIFLGDAHKNVRLAALEGVAQAKGTTDVAPLCQLLRDPDLTVQSKAIETLITLNAPHTLRALLDILQDESEYVRRAAVEVLNVVGTTEAIKDLLAALGDQDWWVRVRAADALGNIGGPKVVEAVLPLLQDTDAFIRRCAIEVLNTTRDPRAFPALVGALDDPDWWVQERAVDALAALGDPQALPALVPLLRRTTPVVPAAVRALGSLGDPQAIPHLLCTLPSETNAIRKEVLQALALLTDAPYAAAVQQAVHQVLQVADGEIKTLAESVLKTLLSKYGNHLRDTGSRPLTAAAPLGSATGPQHMSGSLHRSTLGTTVLDTGAGKSPAAPGAIPVAAVFDAKQLEPGMLLDGRYRVIRRVGKGGFGSAMLVEDTVVHEDIILKFLHPSLAADSDVIKRFIRELRLARKITHENIIRIYDFLSVCGTYAISMEYFPSHTLAAERMPLAIPRACTILRDIFRGVSVAHQADVVHRDLKPQNILINEHDLVKIVDFGLAAGMSADDSRLTQRSARMGTPTYMAPEQVRGGMIDCRTDIYSLGIIMYEFFTGRPPYAGQDAMEIIFQHVEGKPRAPREVVPTLAPALESIILKAMAVRPEDRFQHIDDLGAHLEAFAASMAVA